MDSFLQRIKTCNPLLIFVLIPPQLNRLTRASNIFYLKWDLPPPVSNREGYLIGSGFDRFDINGSILMLARTIHNVWSLPKQRNLFSIRTLNSLKDMV